MYNILETKEIEVLKEKEPRRFEYKLEGGAYLDLRGLELAPVEELDVEKVNRLAKIITLAIVIYLQLF